MDEELFWKYIEQVYSFSVEEYDLPALQNTLLQISLEKHTLDELLTFESIFREKIYQLFLSKIAEVFLITSYDLNDKMDFKYISNDGFIDFRVWIVAQGKTTFEKFLNFTDESEILEYDLNDETAYRADLFNLTSEVYSNVFFDDKENFEDHYNKKYDIQYDAIYEKLYKEMSWEKEELKRKYPIQFEKYQTEIR